MIRFVIDLALMQRLAKAEQLSMFGGPRPAPPPTPHPPHAGSPTTTVHAHVRHTEHGNVVVQQHQRHITAAEAFKMRGPELQQHVAGGGPGAIVAQAEIDRRAAKRAGTTTATEPTPTPTPPEPTATPTEAPPTTATTATEPTPHPLAAELRRFERALEATKKRSLELAERRAALPPGSSRAKVTTANAQWGRVAEERDRLQAHVNALRAKINGTEATAPTPEPEPEPPTATATATAEPSAEPEPSTATATATEPEPTPTPTATSTPTEPHEPALEPEPTTPDAAETILERLDESDAIEETARNDAERDEDLEMRGDGRHRDVGDVLEGARKHRWKKGDAVTPENLRDVEELGEEEAARAVQKQAVFGDYPDHDYNQGLGDTPGASLMKQKLIGAVSKSAGASKTAREWYVSGAEWLRRELDQVHTVEQVAEFVEKWKVGVEGHWVQEEKYTAKELVSLLGDSSESGGWGGSMFFVQDSSDTTPETRNYGGTSYTFNRPKEYQISGSALEQRGFSSIHRVRNADGTTSYQLARPLPRSQNFYAKAAFGLGGFGEFVDAAKALRSKDVKSNRLIRAIMKHGSIWEKDAPEARRIDKLPEAEGWKAVTGKEQGERVRPKRWERAFFGVRRTGGATVPAVVDGDSLRDTFGFRGVQYGNWVEQEARDHHLKQAHGALMDLADLVRVEPKALSHGGTLGLAFGARGHGAAAAHYEPSRAVINLTHTNGAGTFAHEWGHFLDNQLTDNPTGYVMKGPNESRPRMISEMDAPHADVDPKVVDAFHDVMGTILGEDRSPEARELRKRRTELLYQRKSFDGDSAAVHNAAVRTFNRDQENYWSKYPERRRQKTTTYSNHAAVLGDYWSRPHELFARAFESFIEDKLASQNRESSYLVSGTQTLYRLERTKGTRTAKNLEPYPQGTERQAINAAMEKLTDALSKTQALKKAMERLRIRLYALVAA